MTEEVVSSKLLSGRLEVWRFLRAAGFKVGRQSIYNAASAGKLAVQPDGTVYETDALSFAARHLSKTASAGGGGLGDNFYSQKAAEEMALTRVRREKLEFEAARDRGLYLLKSDVRAEIAMKIAVLEAGIKHFFRTFAADWIHRVGGHPKHTRMSIELFNTELDQLLNEFGRLDDIDVLITKGGEEMEAETHRAGADGGIFAVEDGRCVEN